MQVFRGIQEIQKAYPASVVTIGNFDGVHLGHQQLIETVVREAHHFGVPGVVYTFHPHPVKVLHPERPTHRLFDLKDQQEQFEKKGIDLVILENFTEDFSKVSPQTFLDHYIYSRLRPKTLVVGHDFSFGMGREGNIPFLEEYCAQKEIRLIIIPPFKKDNMVVSSSLIRENLRSGDVETANELLGRTYYLRGPVEHGFKRGRTIGVPTANVHPDVEFVPRHGVYCTTVVYKGKCYPSIANIGVNPTFVNKGVQIKTEVHIFDFNEDIYGQEIEIYLHHFIRDERKFTGIEELKSQIQDDMNFARKYFDERKKA